MENYKKYVPASENRTRVSYEGRMARIKAASGNGRKTGAENCRKTFSQPVYRYGLDGYYLEEYPSQQEASRHTGISQGNISECCKGKYSSIGGSNGENIK